MCRDLDTEINSLIKARQVCYRSLFRSPQLNPDKVQGGSTHTVEDTYTKIIDMDLEINKKIDKLADHRKKMMAEIDSLEDRRYRNILRDYYISGLSWLEVAHTNHWTYRHTTRLHGQALEALREKEKMS
nr:DUF1492 domain-containing protein [Aerococcus urinae]